MKVNTRYFGAMEVAPEEVIDLEQGLFGFEDYKKFILIRFDDEDDTMLCFQSLEDASLSFVVVNPFRVLLDYAPKLAKKELQELGVDSDTDLHYYVIAVVGDDFKDTTVNLRCPIAINGDTKKGCQIILDDSSYSMRHPVISSAEGE